MKLYNFNIFFFLCAFWRWIDLCQLFYVSSSIRSSDINHFSKSWVHYFPSAKFKMRDTNFLQRLQHILQIVRQISNTGKSKIPHKSTTTITFSRPTWTPSKSLANILVPKIFLNLPTIFKNVTWLVDNSKTVPTIKIK